MSDLTEKTRPNRIELECDDLDFAVIQRAIAIRQQTARPESGSNVSGEMVAEICRGWLESIWMPIIAPSDFPFQNDPMAGSGAPHCSVADASTALEQTLELLALEVDRRVLRVSKHNERPISELVFCHRRCEQNPPEDIKTLVQALSKQPGMRAFSGESCHKGVYVGNNIWGRNFEKRSTYCPSCGYAMSGPQIDHVEIVKSDDTDWNQRMIDQCEIGAYWHEGENVGLSYELV